MCHGREADITVPVGHRLTYDHHRSVALTKEVIASAKVSWNTAKVGYRI
jgi:hypothetical protein